MVIHTGNPSSQEVKKGKPWLRVQPRLNSKFQASMSCTVRLCLKGKGKVTELGMEPASNGFIKINKENIINWYHLFLKIQTNTCMLLKNILQVNFSKAIDSVQEKA